jgi:2-polyprenyl-3-methyl-5-hydroxy-6-metoxy-1,4-benzoquinol methylase
MSREWEVWDEDMADQLERVWESPAKGRRHQALVEAVSKLILGKSVLDVGCGMGHLYRAIKDEVETYLGVDSSPAMIKKAHLRFDESLFVVGDAYDLSTFPSADTVVCLGVLEHVPEAWPILEQLWSKAKRCIILVTDVGPKQHIIKTPRKGGKYLINRIEAIENLMSLFKKLPSLGKVENYPWHHPSFPNIGKGTTIFVLNKIHDLGIADHEGIITDFVSDVERVVKK